MSSIQTDRFREALLAERQRVLDAIEYLHDDTPGSREESQEMPLDNHLAENASDTLDREIDYTLGENSEHVLAEIDTALRRIDEGTYGTCERCGKPVGEERLEAIPSATQCIDCKRLAERG